MNPCAFEICAFLLLKFQENGEGVLILAAENEGVAIASLDGFQSQKYTFMIEATDIEGVEEEPIFGERMKFVGHARRDELCFDPADETLDEAQFICFIKLKDLNQRNQSALTALASYESKQSHNKIKNENASKAGTDAAQERRPF